MMMSQAGPDYRIHRQSATARAPHQRPATRSTTLHLSSSSKLASRIAGRIVDLSLGGCRIRCDERFPVGIYTRVETEFRIEGLSFRFGGVIQAIHNRHTIGIRFLDMSPRKREQLEQLIEEINEAHAQKAPADNAVAIPSSDLSGL